MNYILEKISSYHLFNYLLPGILFVILLEKLTSYSFIQTDIILGFFVYYFIGLVISRFGSLIIEPIFKKLSLTKFAKHKNFISASRRDSKIEILLEIGNMYRTFVAMLLILGILRLYELLALRFTILNEWNFYILVGALLVIFVLSYKKQTGYISKRVAANTAKKQK